ncbi:MAG TPA: hypothetical protein VGV87_03345, partial [Blastocatellia bacterium]|nr:hypothetical protein [Blastocatellia bacterium]
MSKYHSILCSSVSVYMSHSPGHISNDCARGMSRTHASKKEVIMAQLSSQRWMGSECDATERRF